MALNGVKWRGKSLTKSILKQWQFKVPNVTSKGRRKVVLSEVATDVSLFLVLKKM